MFKPTFQQFATPIRIQHRITIDINGAPQIVQTDASPALDYCAWKGKGGTERTEKTESGSLVVEDTAEVTMWFREDVTEEDRVLLNDNGDLAYEIQNVENVEMRNQFMILKVRRAVNT